MAPTVIVRSYWQSMQSNDFHLTSQWLSEDLECTWPLPPEFIAGRGNFVSINTYYPANDGSLT